ncbi:MAG: hypothetical protein H6677_11855 [Candidatus Obscuribacterales bacterium]|nr:hypothetical protein [Candidatus Obscuribacterales bacterium]
MPETILASLIEKYSTCNSYSDSGRMERFLQVGEWMPEIPEITFLHQFMRPGYIKAKYRSSSNGNSQDYIVLADGDTVRLFRSINGELLSTGLEKDLVGAISSYTGVSDGHLPFILSLLIPDQLPELKLNLARLASVERKSDEDIDGSYCFHLSGMLDEIAVDIWIDKSGGNLVKSDQTFYESDEKRKERIEVMTLMHRETGGEKELFEETFSTNSTLRSVYHYDKVVFNDSMTIESLLDLTE